MNEEWIELARYSLAFWVASGVWLILVGEAIARWREAWIKPALVVYGTIAVWYFGDLVYGGIDSFLSLFPMRILSLALWQVALFLISYRWLVWWLVPKFFQGLPRSSGLVKIEMHELRFFFLVCFVLWLGLVVLAIAMADWNVVGVIWPPAAAQPVGVFSHPGVGSGSDFLIAAAGYVYILVCSSFGVLFVLNKGLLRCCALALIILSWANIWFGPFRNQMLALFLPGLLTYWLFNRSWWQLKALVTLVLFFFVHFWFAGVEESRRGEDVPLSARMNFVRTSSIETEHEGLDMLQELCWMDSLIEVGVYHPNWGGRYFDEIANIVPRTFWAGKPMPGIDYAIARGYGGNIDSKAGVYATIATGMIGQGVANFGRGLGVVTEALLMTCWTGVLARLWLQRARIPRLFLFFVGCGLTFNMGRDVTLLVLWPFWFGVLGVLFWERFFPYRPPASAPPASPQRKYRSPRPKLYTS